jgi:hypothetical protein
MANLSYSNNLVIQVKARFPDSVELGPDHALLSSHFKPRSTGESLLHPSKSSRSNYGRLLHALTTRKARGSCGMVVPLDLSQSNTRRGRKRSICSDQLYAVSGVALVDYTCGLGTGNTIPAP